MSQIAIPVIASSTDRLLTQILWIEKEKLEESVKQTQILEQIAADVRFLRDQADETPVGFKINETKL